MLAHPPAWGAQPALKHPEKKRENRALFQELIDRLCEVRDVDGEKVLVLQDGGDKVRIDRGWIGKVTAKGAVVLEKTGGGDAGAAQPSEKEAGGAAAGGTALVGTSYMDEAREKKKAEMRAKREEETKRREKKASRPGGEGGLY